MDHHSVKHLANQKPLHSHARTPAPAGTQAPLVTWLQPREHACKVGQGVSNTAHTAEAH